MSAQPLHASALLGMVAFNKNYIVCCKKSLIANKYIFNSLVAIIVYAGKRLGVNVAR